MSVENRIIARDGAVSVSILRHQSGLVTLSIRASRNYPGEAEADLILTPGRARKLQFALKAWADRQCIRPCRRGR